MADYFEDIQLGVFSRRLKNDPYSGSPGTRGSTGVATKALTTLDVQVDPVTAAIPAYVMPSPRTRTASSTTGQRH